MGIYANAPRPRPAGKVTNEYKLEKFEEFDMMIESRMNTIRSKVKKVKSSRKQHKNRN